MAGLLNEPKKSLSSTSPQDDSGIDRSTVYQLLIAHTRMIFCPTNIGTDFKGCLCESDIYSVIQGKMCESDIYSVIEGKMYEVLPLACSSIFWYIGETHWKTCLFVDLIKGSNLIYSMVFLINY